MTKVSVMEFRPSICQSCGRYIKSNERFIKDREGYLWHQIRTYEDCVIGENTAGKPYSIEGSDK